MKNVLVVGSGGREHAIAYSMSQSEQVASVFVCPGNAGMERTSSKIKTQKTISATDLPALLEFAKKEKIDLTIVGPESILSLGIVDLFRENGLLIVGPTKAASLLETSKAFAKTIMLEAQVPTASYQEFFSASSALDYIQSAGVEQMVVKCDGLAAGKGVVVCSNKAEAQKAVVSLMQEALLGENVDHIIIEEFLEGTEVSAFALCDCSGDSFIFLGTACDHKRLRDQDLGPNTGGMGVFSPATVFDSSDEHWVNEHVFSPMLKTMKKKGIPFSGILFAGLMKTKTGWSVLEFNVRLGDPETQVLLPLIAEDLFPLFFAAANGSLQNFKSPIKKNLVGVHVVMAAYGYPGTEGLKVRSGDEIVSDKDFEKRLSRNDLLFYAGVTAGSQSLVTCGGRVLGITSLSENFSKARAHAYELISKIHFEGAQYRRDIGAQES